MVRVERQDDPEGTVSVAAERVFCGPGEMCELGRHFDWASTPLGPVETWPGELRAVTRLALTQPVPMAVIASAGWVLFYNDAYRRTAGSAHPDAFGRDVRGTSPQIAERLVPLVGRVFSGEAFSLESVHSPFLDRRTGVVRQAWNDVHVSPVRDDADRVLAACCVLPDVTERVLASGRRERDETDVHTEEAGQPFLVRLDDTLRPLADPAMIQAEATRLIGQHLDASRAYYARIDPTRGLGWIDRDYARDDAPSVAGEYRLTTFPTIAAELLAGRTMVIDDVEALATVKPDERAACRALGLRAAILRPLVKSGVLVGVMVVVKSVAHHWSGRAIALVDETAERSWEGVERARAEIELKETQSRLEQALATSRMAYWEWDPVRDVTIASPLMDDLFGLLPGERFGSSAQGVALLHPDDREPHTALVRRAVALGEGWHAEFRIVRPRDGAIVWLEEHTTVTREAVTGAVRVTGLVRDVTDRKRAETAAELERRVRERDLLRRELTAAEEAERSRLSREVHDQLGQHLTAVSLGLAESRRKLEAGELAVTHLAQLEELARIIARDARQIALELRPPELDDVGLESALQSSIAQWSARYDVEVELAVSGEVADRPLPSEAGTTLYRIVQEALTNVARHAGARHVSILLDKRDHDVRLIVEDDGKGFDVPSTLQRASAERRLGLSGMRERVALVGGAIEVESRPGGGTTLYVHLPLADQRQV